MLKGADVIMNNRNNNIEVADDKIIDINKNKRRNMKYVKVLGTIAAVFAIVLGLIGYFKYSKSNQIESIVALDINPSVEISLNNFDRVVEAKALNSDGEKVLKGMDLKNVDMDVAINAIVGSLLKNGYISEVANSVLVSVKNDDEVKASEIEEKIIDEVEKILKASKIDAAILSQMYDDSDNEIKPDSKPERKPDFSNIWGTEDFFPVKKEEHTETEIVEKEYVKNLVDLFKDYNTELHNILSNFWTNLILATSNKSSSEIRLLLDNIVLSSSEIIESAKHLLDSAVRQQLLKDMKIDYYNMMFNAENTIKHLQQLKAMQELRLRYSKIKEVEGNTKTNQNNNNILKASKYAYNRKYEIAYENLYRYLNSSNRVLKDTLQTWIQEIKSKQILIERNGIL